MTTHPPQTLGSPARFRAGVVASTPYLMPAAEALTMSKLLLTVMSLIPLGVVVAGPTSSDYWAVAGAALAALLSGLYALSKRRSYLVVALHIISAGTVGSLGPGFLLWLVAVFHANTHAHLEHTATWQVWGAVGLFCGLGGWAIVHAIMQRWEMHADDVAARPFQMFSHDEE